jgi:DNA-binding response OmpR family regulator
MSGYSGDIVALNGVLEAGVDFIQKPFSVTDIVARLRGLLERG